MIYPMVPFPLTLSDPYPRFEGHGVIIDPFDVLCAQLTRDLFAIAKFLLFLRVLMCELHINNNNTLSCKLTAFCRIYLHHLIGQADGSVAKKIA